MDSLVYVTFSLLWLNNYNRW